MRVTLLPAVLLLAVTTATPSLKAPSSAEICGDCHRAIHEGWKKSGHATAMESRLFQDALKTAEGEFGRQGRNVCLACHSPVGSQLGDAELDRKVSWEGVTCDYCHSIREVAPSGGNFKARVDFTGAKSGPSREATSPAVRNLRHSSRRIPLCAVTLTSKHRPAALVFMSSLPQPSD